MGRLRRAPGRPAGHEPRRGARAAQAAVVAERGQGRRAAAGVWHAAQRCALTAMQPGSLVARAAAASLSCSGSYLCYLPCYHACMSPRNSKASAAAWTSRRPLRRLRRSWCDADGRPGAAEQAFGERFAGAAGQRRAAGKGCSWGSASRGFEYVDDERAGFRPRPVSGPGRMAAWTRALTLAASRRRASAATARAAPRSAGCCRAAAASRRAALCQCECGRTSPLSVFMPLILCVCVPWAGCATGPEAAGLTRPTGSCGHSLVSQCLAVRAAPGCSAVCSARVLL